MAAADATLSSSDRQTAFSGENNRRQRAAGLQPEPFRQSSGRMENLLLLLPNRPQRVLVRYGRICFGGCAGSCHREGTRSSIAQACSIGDRHA
jgi:hypothetical protein